MIKIILANHLDPTRPTQETMDFDIETYDHSLGRDWQHSLNTEILGPNLPFHHDFCFLGFKDTYRNEEYLCNRLNHAISELNKWLKPNWDYYISETYTPKTFTQESHNILHNHFEILKGTIWEPSEYFTTASAPFREHIETLNWACHEMETLDFAQTAPEENLRPTNIMSWKNAPKHDLTDEHRKLFAANAFDSELGGVYMHWCQIGKRLDEVFKDEGAPDLVFTDPTDIRTKQEEGGAHCEAITALRYYSGEFNINWGRDMTRRNNNYWLKWHEEFYEWLERNGIDSTDPKMSLGQLPVGKVKMAESFGTSDPSKVWDILKNHMYVKGVEID